MTPAILLDRDGTVTTEVGPVLTPDRLRLLPDSAAAIRSACAAGFRAAVVTNQSAVARGLLSEEDLERVHGRLLALLGEEGATLDGIYHCPHHPEHGAPPYRRACDCRKPKPGLVLRAACDLGLDLARSYMVGDRMRDLQAGRAAGTRTILVLTGYGRDEFGYHATRRRAPVDHVATDLSDAVHWILERERDVNGRVIESRQTP
jgi:D-glycero-D-manno-heptose 1,7-bisphosphate phosphatase